MAACTLRSVFRGQYMRPAVSSVIEVCPWDELLSLRQALTGCSCVFSRMCFTIRLHKLAAHGGVHPPMLSADCGGDSMTVDWVALFLQRWLLCFAVAFCRSAASSAGDMGSSF